MAERIQHARVASRSARTGRVKARHPHQNPEALTLACMWLHLFAVAFAHEAIQGTGVRRTRESENDGRKSSHDGKEVLVLLLASVSSRSTGMRASFS